MNVRLVGRLHERLQMQRDVSLLRGPVHDWSRREDADAGRINLVSRGGLFAGVWDVITVGCGRG